MKAIILAAGRGTRLAPLTDTVPKCMVEYHGKTLIKTIHDCLTNCGIQDVSIVGGYKIDVLKEHMKGKGVKFYFNEQFASTNMVHSLFCATPEMNDDVIISYSDIIYDSGVVKKLVAETAPLSVIIDRKWNELWQLRMENPLDDAETLKLDSQNNITELGKKAKNYSDIRGQYIGLLKIRKEAWKQVGEFYNSLDKSGLYDGKDFDNMFMTSFLQMIIDRLMPAKAVMIDRGWLEIDSIADMKAYERNNLVISQ